MNILAAVLRETRGPLVLESLEVEAPRANEVLVRMVACGICHTDVACRDAVIPLPLPIVLGHEGAGVIEAVGGEVSNLEPGDHVLLSFAHCGVCSSCVAAHAPYCHDFGSLNFAGGRPDGTSSLTGRNESIHSHFFGQSAFASYAIVPQNNAIKIDKTLPLNVLAPLGCGIQTGAGAIFNTLRPQPGESIAVFGTGSVGMSSIMAAKVSGCTTIIAVDRVAGRLELAKEMGATHVISALDTPDLASAVRECQLGGVHYAVDTTGIGAVVASAINSLRPLGICALLGIFPPGVQLPLDPRYLLLNGLTLRGVVEGDSQPNIFIPKLIDLYSSGLFPIERLITQFPFSEVNAALNASASCKTLKPVLIF
jgi:aryl-alcohol dehydrogenase